MSTRHFKRIVRRAVSRILPCLLAIALLLTVPLPLRAQGQSADPGATQAPLRVPWVSAPGFGTLAPDGKVISFAADVARMVADEAGLELDFVEYDTPAALIEAARDGETDMIGSIGRLRALQDIHLFYGPVAQLHFVLYVRNDAPNDWTIDTFQGRRIGVIRNTAAAGMSLPEGAELITFDEQITALGKLLIGEVDGVVMVHARGDRTIRSAGIGELVRVTSPPVLSRQFYLALSDSRAGLGPRVSDALERIETSGALEVLRERWAMVLPPEPPEALTVGVTHFPPYQVITEDGQLTGFSVEVLRALAQRASVDLQFEPITGESWAAGPRPGAFDLVPARSVNAEESQQLEFSLPIQTIDYAPHVRAGSNLQITAPTDLADLRVGLQFTSPIRARIEAEIGAPVIPIENVAAGIDALRNDEIDVLIYPALSVSDLLDEEGLQDEVTRLNAPIFSNGLAIAMRPGVGDLKRRLDVVIPGYLGTSDYRRLSRTWLETPPYWTPERLQRLFRAGGVVLLLALLAFLAQNWRAKTVAERLRAEALAANERLSSIMANTRQAIFGFDAGGEIAVINPSGRALLASTDATAPARWPDEAEFLDPVSRAPFTNGDDPLQRALSGEPVHGHVCLFRRDRNHQPRFVRVSGDAIHDSRTALRALLIVEDEHDNELTRQKLDRSHRLSSMGQLTGGLAHDFNNILATVLYNAELAKMMAEVPDQPLLDRIIDTVRSGSDLTRRLLAFARRSPEPARAVNVARSLKETEALARPVIGETIRLDIEEVAEDVHIHCDRSELETALLNLILNARDAITGAGKGDTVSVQLRCYDLLDADTGPGRQPVVEISVSDNGPGMTEDVRQRATDPFFSTKTETGGTGLGLAMVESFVTRSDGLLSIYSEPGLGTTVRLRVPRVTAEDTAPPTQAAPELARGNDERILLVEDQHDLREPMAELVRGLGYRVETAETADAAIERLDSGASFDLVLSDIVMPGTHSGLGLAEHLRSRHPDVAAVLMTGFADVGADEVAHLDLKVLRKPCPLPDLARALRDALARARAADTTGTGADPDTPR
ncbi:transporter substrate-binding domain-containing protein [Marinibacterium profundimaris]|uniref:transporter substrate-binding domain-containing protein n=1 Tax=Marinibacterium profundimaris TaxID=1679460 RepID=UPI000B5215E7|nr:transporter substrate-binding domain-containing protein [Marinibacterium profundimaris]